MGAGFGSGDDIVATRTRTSAWLAIKRDALLRI